MMDEFQVMKKTMSQLSNELTRMKLSQGHNQGYQCPTPNQGNTYAQNPNKGYDPHNNNNPHQGNNNARNMQDKPNWVPQQS